MSFTFSLTAAVFLLCMGGAVGCLVCMLCGKLFHKQVLKIRLTVFCLLLSVAIAVVAFQLIFSPAMFASLLQVARSHLIFLFVLFCAGLLCACFWRSFLPFAVMTYIACSIFIGVKLYAAFGANEDSLSVSVSATSIKVNENVFPVTNPQGKSIVLKTYTLPPELLLPVPRVWYTVCGVASTDERTVFPAVSELTDFSGSDSATISFFGKGRQTSLEKYLQTFSQWVLSKHEYTLLPLPETSVLPSLYSIKLQVSGETISYAVTRSL